MQSGKFKIAAADFETDPFKSGRLPEPFAVEVHCDEFTWTHWGDDAAQAFVDFCKTLKEPYIIYFHNGGKFDCHLFKWALSNPIRMINARLVSARLGIHEIRDSYSIIPVPLRKFGQKKEIDYDKMERPLREKHKTEIMDYLHMDCVSLYDTVVSFIGRFGRKLTVGSTAMAEIQKRHSFERQGRQHDETFRRFYFGGRVQCFQSGIIKGPVKSYDVNSQYPTAMRDYKHPINGAFDTTSRMPDNFDRPFFIHFSGRNENALPNRSDDGGTDFEKHSGEFYACSHEIEIALEHNLIEIDEIHECLIAEEWISFDQFVNDFYAEKVEAKRNNDIKGEQFAKFMLNSGYGKFAQNPENFRDYLLVHDFGNDEELRADGYELEIDHDTFEVWSRPAHFTDTAFFDVSTAASITSAARAILLSGLQSAYTPLYCDTDSIICRSFDGSVSDYELGAWKHETTSTHAAIAGKKLYMLYDANRPFNVKGTKTFNPAQKPNPYKLASKGGTVPPADMLKICQGESVTIYNDAPTFSFKKLPTFINRSFKMTA